MDYQLSLLKLLYKDGFINIIDKLDNLLNNEETLINLVILNLDSNNINLLCNMMRKPLVNTKSNLRFKTK